MSNRRPGFTLIEVLVAVTIIAILIGALLPALALLRRHQRSQETRALLNSLEYGLTQYLDSYGVLGDGGDAEQFEEKPWVYLGVRQLEAGRAPFVDPGPKRLKGGTPEAMTPAGALEATQICDAWGGVLVWEIENQSLAGKQFSNKIHVISTAGTPGKPSDDLHIRWNSEDAKWVRE